jgi:hypothetical protein
MGVRQRLSKPDLLEDLLLFLERRGCPAPQLDVDLIGVEVPHAIHAEPARVGKQPGGSTVLLLAGLGGKRPELPPRAAGAINDDLLVVVHV